MKKVIALFLVVALCLSLTACVKNYNSVNDYQMIYGNVKNANKTFTKSGQKDTLLEFEEYAYCSYLLLFPRQTPNKLTDFDYGWTQGIDYDDYFIYFTYQLEDDEFDAFKESLSEFSVSYEDQIKKPIYTETHFEYPTYIMSWTDEVDMYGNCEYIMLDESTNTVINVFKLHCYKLEEVQEKAFYNIMPVDNNFAAVEELCGDDDFYFAKNVGFSVYSFLDEKDEFFAPDIKDLSYDNSFVKEV